MSSKGHPLEKRNSLHTPPPCLDSLSFQSLGPWWLLVFLFRLLYYISSLRDSFVWLPFFGRSSISLLHIAACRLTVYTVYLFGVTLNRPPPFHSFSPLTVCSRFTPARTPKLLRWLLYSLLLLPLASLTFSLFFLFLENRERGTSLWMRREESKGSSIVVVLVATAPPLCLLIFFLFSLSLYLLLSPYTFSHPISMYICYIYIYIYVYSKILFSSHFCLDVGWKRESVSEDLGKSVKGGEKNKETERRRRTCKLSNAREEAGTKKKATLLPRWLPARLPSSPSLYY